MTTPSSDEIQKVKDNLNNIISFNKDLLNQANMKLENAYALLTEPDKSDLGLQISINLLGGCFWALGSVLGPLGSIPANFLSGLVSNYATDTPPSLNGLFSSLIIRLQNTFNQVDLDLAIYNEDPVANWDKVLSGTFDIPFQKISPNGKLGDLSKIDFPKQDNPNYYTIQNACIKALDQTIWATLLNKFVITHYILSNNQPWEDLDYNAWDNSFLRSHKSYYHTWTPIDNTDKHGGHYTTLDQEEYNIGTGAGMFSDGALNDDACNYIFINYSSDIANPDGLFNRKDFFTKLNLPTAEHYINNRFRLSTYFRSTYEKPYVFHLLKNF
jgi:hypothetical protein